MNYSNHNLRTDLQEWKNRIYRAPYAQFSNQLKYLIDNLDKNIQIQGLIKEACIKHPYSNEQLEHITEQRQMGSEMVFDNETHQTAFCYQLVKYLIQELGNYNLHNLMMFQGRDFDATKGKIIEDCLSPIIYYLHDRLDKSNSTIYLLEKYKKRTEWFTKKLLHQQDSSATRNYEQIFEDDLRLFLFDQGIDYPFSTPLSASGRVDIIGEIETDEDMINRIKFDVYYIENWSFLLDIKTIVQTVINIFEGEEKAS